MAMRKPVVTTKLPGVMKEFGEGNGVIYVDRPEDALRRAVELIESGMIEEYGPAARRFVGTCGWDDVVDEFEGIPDTEYYSDISEFLEDAVKTLMDVRRDLRIAIACTLYEKGKISLGRAMEIVDVDIERMKEILVEHRIKLRRGVDSVEEMEEELKGLEI
jgi:predicted HTH domain antitoxin